MNQFTTKDFEDVDYVFITYIVHDNTDAGNLPEKEFTLVHADTIGDLTQYMVTRKLDDEITPYTIVDKDNAEVTDYHAAVKLMDESLSNFDAAELIHHKTQGFESFKELFEDLRIKEKENVT